jgi:hypothetical protein
MSNDDFSRSAAEIALQQCTDQLREAQRTYEDSARYSDPELAASALRSFASARAQYNELVGATQPQQQAGQLSQAQRDFLLQRQRGGDVLDQNRMGHYARGHDRALAAGLRVDSPEYFAAVANHVDHLGDGRQKPLSEEEAAKICGIDQYTYSDNADRLRALKAAGHYRDGQ